MPHVTNSPIQQQRISEAGRLLTDKMAGYDIYQYEATGRRYLATDVISLVKEGLIDPQQLPELARDLIRRGTDFNPFNNHNFHGGSRLRSDAAVVATVAQKRYQLSLD